MKEIEYKVLGVDDLELLVKIRIKDLKMFSNQKITNSTIENIRVFYKEKMLDLTGIQSLQQILSIMEVELEFVLEDDQIIAVAYQ